MVNYQRDEATGTVHLMMPLGDGESTFCNRMIDGDTSTGGFFSETHIGPSNCSQCCGNFRKFMKDCAGARFAKKLVLEVSEDW